LHILCKLHFQTIAPFPLQNFILWGPHSLRPYNYI